MTFEQLLEQADQQLFDKLCNNSDHCLHSLLPPPSTASKHYKLRQRAHNRIAPERTQAVGKFINVNNFIVLNGWY